MGETAFDLYARQWLKDIINREKEKVKSVPGLEEDKMNACIAKLDTLTGLKCSICLLPGHLSNHCWLNAQMYVQTKENPDAGAAWEMVKYHATVLKQQQQRKAVEELKQELDLKKLETAALKVAAKRGM